MNETMESTRKVNHGRNVKFARENWHDERITQEQLAEKLGKQQRDIHAIEQSETLDDELLYKISDALNVPFDFLKNCPLKEDLKRMVESHNNTFNDSSSDYNAYEQNFNCNNTQSELKLAEQVGILKTENKYLRAELAKYKSKK